jgi:hypothetical protein
MPRYIDVEKLGIGKANRDVFEKPEYADGWNSAIEIIESAPTADVVEVVWCKDCTEFHIAEGCAPSYCVMTGCGVDGDDFCSYGERRKDG